ncbi:MAG: monovalent cation/H(+) antiporter subunit G [Terriglobales bacterium]
MKTIAIEVLLGTAVLLTLLSVLGMVRMRDPYQRMHYIAPPASLSATFITLAIFLQRGFKPESFKALFITFVLIGMNSVVTHAAARAFRIAEVADWHPDKGEEVPIKPSDKIISEYNS